MNSKLTPPKPDAAIQRNISRARRGTAGEKAKGFVVAASLAVTLLGAALFAHDDAQTAALQASNTPASASVTQAGTTTTDTAQTSAAPTVAATPTSAAATTNATTSSTRQAAFASTRSSR